MISWTYTGTIPSILLEISTDSGVTFAPIFSTNNTGSVDLEIPDTPSTHCLIRVSDYLDGNPFDVSDSFFTIVEPICTVTVSSGGNGSVVPSGQQIKGYRDSLLVTATPVPGYHFVNWSASGASVLEGDSTGVFLILGNATITANFAKTSYLVNVSSGGYGTVSPSGSQNISHGDTLNVTATPYSGYHFANWSTTGGVEIVDGSESGKFRITGAGAVTANFAKTIYTINVSSAGNGTVVPSGGQSVGEGDTLSVTATPSTGYHFYNWVVTGGVTQINGDSTGLFLITGNGTIIANFAINTYQVTVSSGGNGTVNPSGPQSISYGDTLSVTAAPDGGYRFANWSTTGGVAIINSSLSGKFRITGNGSITANFELNPNHTPVDITISYSIIRDKQPIGTVVGVLSAVDQDSGDIHTFQLVSGGGDSDNDSFSLSADTLVTAAVLDHEIKNLMSIRVRATDTSGAWVEKVFAINVIPEDSILYAYPRECGADENLIVDGQIKCNSVLIHNWLLSQAGAAELPPDYVFKAGYDLQSLKEIEEYITKTGHLPGIPSAGELEKNGVDLIQLNFLLLKKIEEMTLHMIRQEKEIEKLKKEVK